MGDDVSVVKRRAWYYILVTNAGGVLLFVRIPLPRPRWSVVLKGLTGVMREHGLKQKDIGLMDGYGDDRSAAQRKRDAFWERTDEVSVKLRESDELFLQQLDAAYAGDASQLPSFWLYDWQAMVFALVRQGVKKTQ